MNKIVRENYPVDRLPEDLRRNLPMSGTVRVVIESPSVTADPEVSEWFASIIAKRDNVPASPEDPVDRVRRQRDEWND